MTIQFTFTFYQNDAVLWVLKTKSPDIGCPGFKKSNIFSIVT